VPRLKGDLGPLERAVMEIVWDRDEEMSVRDLLEAPVGEGHAYTTLMTVLDRLWRKGYLVRRKVGRAYVYRSRLTREQHVENLVTQVLAGAKDRSGALLGFVRGVDEEDLADLRKAIRQVEQERRAGR
jgi:predicted transcriptional regulator